MPDQTARDAAVGYLTRRGVHETTARVWARGILAALGIPPDTTVQDVREALALLDRDRTGKAWLDAPYLETDHA